VPSSALKAIAAESGVKLRVARSPSSPRSWGQNAYVRARQQYGGGTRISQHPRKLLKLISGKGNWHL
jgi:ribosomal protein L44E